MAASPQTADTAPLFLTGLTLTYNGRHFRQTASDVIGQGVADYDSFRVRQRAAGSNMSVDVGTASVQNRAYVRDTGSTDSGHYRVAYNSATPLNLDIAAADATNPRIDTVYLAVEDSQDTGSNNKATVRMVTGTATGGATLDNRTGVGSAPAGMSSILIADILVAAAAGSIANAAIRDRRPFGIRGAGPTPYTPLEQVSFTEAPGMSFGANTAIQSTANSDAQQAAALMYLPRRIVAATKLRFKALQGTTATSTNYNIAICDASGRPIVSTGAVAYGGTASQQVLANITITSTTLDAGYYWVWIGNAAGTAGGTVTALGINGALPTSISGPNQFVFATSGGTTLPTTILSMTDAYTITGTPTVARVSVPAITLSVG